MRHAFTLLCLGSLVGCAPEPAKPPPLSSDKGPPAILELKKRDDALKVDKVGPSDGDLAPNGKMDATFDATVRGPILALLLDAEGDSLWQWDTYVGLQTVPVQMKALQPKGGLSGGIGVFENGQLLSAKDGQLRIDDDRVHHLVLYVDDNGEFKPGAGFKLYAETADHQVIESQIVTF